MSASDARPWSRWLVLLGALIVQLILGTVYGYSIFWGPLQEEVFGDPATMATVESSATPSDRPAAERATAESARDIAPDAAASEPDEPPTAVDPADAGETAPVATNAPGAATPDAESARVLSDQQKSLLRYAYSICLLTFALTMVPAGRLQDLIGPGRTALIGAVLIGGGFFTAAWLQTPIVFLIAHAAFIGLATLVAVLVVDAWVGKRHPEWRDRLRMAVAAATITAGVIIGNRLVGNLGPVDRLLLLWGAIGLLAGAGIGFGYVCPIAALVKWFPRSKGLVSGIAVAGFGFGAFIFTSPYLPFSAENFIQEYGITRTFMVHGLVCLLGVGGGAMLLRNPPKVEAVASASPSPQGGGASPAAASNDFTWRETLRTPAFYALWFMFFSGAMAGLMIIGVLKEFAGEQLVRGAMAGGGSLSDEARTSLLQQGAEAVGWLAIFNAVGRVAWGSASDRIGRTGAFIAMFLLQAAVLLSLCVMDWRPELAGPWTLAIAASLIGFNFGGNFALFPSATADRFGPTNLGANYGWLYTSYGIAGLVGVAVGNFARTQTGSYTVALLVAAVLCIFAAGLAVLLTRMDRRPKDAADPGVAPA